MRPTPAPPAARNRTPLWETRVRIALLTRLFGGGARARELDPVGWLRSAAAKSALRAWWRAGEAHRFSSLTALREREDRLFGTSTRYAEGGAPLGGPGALSVTVNARPCSASREYDLAPSDPLQVAYFPAAPLNQKAGRLGLPESTAPALLALSSRDPEEAVREELLGGLRLWLTLGGVGSRTRRGAGAIGPASPEKARAIGVPTSIEELEMFLRLRCSPHPMGGDLVRIFSLSRTRSVLLGRPVSDPEEAQSTLLSALRAARQERKPSAHGYGRSTWPEADAVRWKEGGAYVHPPASQNRDQYPRAALGLPIVMHFKDGPRRDPQDHHVLAALPTQEGWVKLDRFASPILLRPVRVWEGQTARYVPVALFTDCALPPAVRPLVTVDPKAAARPGDVVGGYDLVQQAGSTLDRIAAVFLKKGFRALEGLTS
jgi:CRISPR-associated protein Cmr1